MLDVVDIVYIFVSSLIIGVYLAYVTSRHKGKVKAKQKTTTAEVVPREIEIRCGSCNKTFPKSDLVVLVDYLYNHPKVFYICPFCKNPLQQVDIELKKVERFESGKELEEKAKSYPADFLKVADEIHKKEVGGSGAAVKKARKRAGSRGTD
jgi:hypothetical protein